MSGKTQEAYRIVDVNQANIGQCGLLCLKSKKKTEGYKNKVKWAKERFRDGLRIKLLLVNEGAKRGLTARGFIEYIPGEYAWRGIDAEGCMVINCIWVVGQHRGHGYGSKLLMHCLNDAKGMNGVAVVAGRTWLPGARLLLKHGFERVDSKPPDVELFAKRFSDKAPLPKFATVSRDEFEKCGHGITVLKSDQCPYVDGAVKEMAEAAKQVNLPILVRDIKTCEEARHSIHPYGTFCVLLDGKVITYRPIGARGLLNLLSKTNSSCH
jgi:GNAT superfamily N-acetyltransferase